MLTKYLKFKSKVKCIFPERDNRKYYKFNLNNKRFKYIKCISCGNWCCIYKKSLKSETNEIGSIKKTTKLKSLKIGKAK
jgi:hypothetical protein